MKGWLGLILLFLMQSAYGLIISEIMYDPLDGNEWIELYNKDEINIEGLTLSDNLNTDEIVCCSFNAGCSYVVPEDTYFLIVDQDTTLEVDGRIFCVDDNSIGNGLGNSGDSVSFKIESIEMANVTYEEGITKGSTLSLQDDIWQESSPSPWAPNLNSETQEETAAISSPELEIVEISSEIIFIGVKSKFFKVANNDYPDYKDALFLDYYWNISRDESLIYEEAKEISFKSYTTDTGEYIFEEEGNYIICARTGSIVKCIDVQVEDGYTEKCDISLTIDTEKQIYEEGEKITIRHELSSKDFPFEIDYWIEDINGDQIKDKTRTDNTNKKSYTPNLDDDEKAMVLKAELFAHCNNSNPGNAEKLIVVKGDQLAKSSAQSSITIEKISPETINFGDTFFVKLNAIKGDTRKTVVELKVKGKEIVSETTNFYMDEKNQMIDITIPVKLKQDCSYETGGYNLIIDGIDAHEEKEIQISAVPCIDISKNSEYELVSYFCKESYCYEIIKISNDEDLQHEYEISSYVYVGAKVFSGEREGNLQLLSLGPHAIKYINLENELVDAPDDAKIKIRIKREDRKNPHEFAEDITLEKQVEKSKEISVGVANTSYQKKEEANLTNESKITGGVIYRSSSEKTKDLSKYLVIICVLFGVYALISQMKK
ncbi:MAG: lamin tail domain-containing protein [archaeon]